MARELLPSATYEPGTYMLYLNAVALVPYNKTPCRHLLVHFSGSGGLAEMIARALQAQKRGLYSVILEIGGTGARSHANAMGAP